MGKRRKNWRDKSSKKKRNNPQWKDIVKSNDLMERFYKMQAIVPEDEWEEFMLFSKKDLPSTFRITKIRGNAYDLLRSLKEGYINKIADLDLKEITVSEKSEENPENELDLLLEPIDWYPEDLAWNFNLSRRFIRRSEILQQLHRFLVEDSEVGAITRQEAVSMIPPMFLDVQSHHIVLDMCAAPGSKTAQIIEMLHADTDVPTGAVLANDVTQKRCYMLTHQAKRLNTPCVVITNHDAKIFPKMTIKNEKGDSQLPLKFDRILCDVPCSGDGTLRKNPLIWTKWNPSMALGLYKLQSMILIRGLEMLKVGGRLVYSTCSFNPIENEAVLANVLSRVNGSVELVDCTGNLSKLKRRPGMHDWKVFDKHGKEFSSYDEVTTTAIHASMFPPTKEVAQSIKLERAMRIYPHLQNTGGFFIAVLRKKAELPWTGKKNHENKFPWDEKNSENAPSKSNKIIQENLESESTENEQIDKLPENADPDNLKDETEYKGNERPFTGKMKRGSLKEDPFIFLDDTDTDLASVRNFYGIPSKLPTEQLLVRSQGEGTKKRHIYFVSKSVQNIMNCNKNLNIVNTGVRIVTRSNFNAGTDKTGIEFRLVQEGIFLMSSYLTKRIINITQNDLVELLTKQEIPYNSMSEEARAQLDDSDMGCVVWCLRAEKCEMLTSDVWFCGHQGKVVVQIMLSKDECKHYLRLLGVEIPQHLMIKEKGAGWGDAKQQAIQTSNSAEEIKATETPLTDTPSTNITEEQFNFII